MSLTTGKGPLSPKPAGRFSVPLPEGIIYIEPFNRRVRGFVGDRCVVDTEAALLVHRPGQPPTYAFPEADVDRAVDGAPAEPEPDAPGHLRIPWDSLDTWFEEDEQVFGHPRNPYHRVDCIATSRHLRVEVGGVELVDTTSTTGVYETSLAPKLYVERSAVRTEVLVPSTTTTYCPYKGTASYWSAVVDGETFEDVAWSYEDPLPESLPLRGLLSFDPARATVATDLPKTSEISPPNAG